MPRMRAAALLLGCCLVAKAPLWAEERHNSPPATVGSSPRVPPETRDSELAALTARAGIPVIAMLRPKAEASLCSPLHPVCVHSSFKGAAALPGALKSLETAYRLLMGALSLPRPLPSWTSPNGISVYLSDDRKLPSLSVGIDTPSVLSDRATAFCVIPRVAIKSLALSCLAQAITHWLDASETAASRNAYACHLSAIVEPMANAALVEIDDFQANPERTPIASGPLSDGSAGALFYEALERTWQHPQPGWFATALFSLSRGNAASSGMYWHNEPDWFDVVRYSFGDRIDRTADWLSGFALDRALLGLSPVGSRLHAFRRIGEIGRVRFDWKIPFSTLPRRVALSKPLEPLGAAYIWLDLDQPAANATLGFRADWEPPVAFKWVLLGIDGAGREVTRLDLPFLDAATSVERTWTSFADQGARAIIIAGVNMGGIDEAHPFDPDYAPWETHGATVYLAKL